MTIRLAMMCVLTGCVAANGYVVPGARMADTFRPPGVLQRAHGVSRAIGIDRVDSAGGHRDIVDDRDFADVQADALAHPDRDYLLVDGRSEHQASVINGVLGAVAGLAVGALASSMCTDSVVRARQYDDATPYFCMLLTPVGGVIGGLVGGLWRTRVVAVRDPVELPVAATTSFR